MWAVQVSIDRGTLTPFIKLSATAHYSSRTQKLLVFVILFKLNENEKRWQLLVAEIKVFYILFQFKFVKVMIFLNGFT